MVLTFQDLFKNVFNIIAHFSNLNIKILKALRLVKEISLIFL